MRAASCTALSVSAGCSSLATTLRSRTLQLGADALRALGQLGARRVHAHPDLAARIVQAVTVAPDHGHRESHGGRAYPGRVAALMTSLRDHGLRIGTLEPGPRNSIADVEGVRVGHVTVVRDEPDPPAGRGVARSGVTAILPRELGRLRAEPVVAGTAVLNGAGELTGSLQIREWGLFETPVYLTATMSVGRVYDGAVALAAATDPDVGLEAVVIPVVGECDDSWLNDARTVQVEAADAARAVEAAGSRLRPGRGGRRDGDGLLRREGRDRQREPRGRRRCTVGVLVLANFGDGPDLRVDGVPVGQLLERTPAGPRRPAGSCIAVVATDAALDSATLERLARRAGLGLARTGSVAHHGSGEIFLAFSTTARPGGAPHGGRRGPALLGRRGRHRGGGAERALERGDHRRPRRAGGRRPARTTRCSSCCAATGGSRWTPSGWRAGRRGCSNITAPRRPAPSAWPGRSWTPIAAATARTACASCRTTST